MNQIGAIATLEIVKKSRITATTFGNIQENFLEVHHLDG